MIVVPVIMAGGIGERFWPLSRSSSPKQLLKLIRSRPMVEETLNRVAPLCTNGVKPLIITGRTIAGRMRKMISPKLEYDCIVEPVGKNTAPAILLAAGWIRHHYGEAVMCILSADHNIKPRSSFITSVRTAVAYARQSGSLVVFGIQPSRPECGYGYLHIEKTALHNTGSNLYRVKKFIEKPSPANAKRYVKQNSYLWNSGMFVWKTSVIINEFQKHLPEMFSLLAPVIKRKFSQKSIDRFYFAAESESIDYGIMEKAREVVAVKGTFFWDDIGSWEALPRIHGKDVSGNTTIGKKVLEYECRETLVFNSSDAAVTTIGIENLAVIVSGDAILIADRSKLPDLKKYLKQMKKSRQLPDTLF